jgi:hypothetical protein
VTQFDLLMLQDMAIVFLSASIVSLTLPFATPLAVDVFSSLSLPPPHPRAEW